MERAQRFMLSSALSGEWCSSSLWGHAAVHDLPCYCHHVAAGWSPTSVSPALVYMEMLVLPCLPLMVPALSTALLMPFTIPFQPCFPGLCCLCVPHG